MQKDDIFRMRAQRLDSASIPPTFMPGPRAVAVLVLLAAFLQSACFFRAKEKAIMPVTPVSIAFLPLNTPEGDKDLQWTSMAMPIMMDLIARDSETLKPVPLWETMRFTLESVGNSRTVMQQNAAYAANWLNAKWAAVGSLSKAKGNKVTLMVDFIPPDDTTIPFRYLKNVNMNDIDANVRKAFNQFLGYISAPVLEKTKEKHITLASLRQLAEAVDKEYGWTVAADPGKSEEIVANLVQSDRPLAQYLFNPSLYPILQDK